MRYLVLLSPGWTEGRVIPALLHVAAQTLRTQALAACPELATDATWWGNDGKIP
jgi:hypothetical protein